MALQKFVHQKTNSGMFTAALYIIAPNKKQFDYPSTEGQFYSKSPYSVTKVTYYADVSYVAYA